MQLHILKLQTCSLNTLLFIISSPALQKSQCYSCVFSFSPPLENKQANNKTMSWELTFQHFFPCFSTVVLTNVLTEKPAQDTHWWPAAKLSWSMSPKQEQQAGMIPVHISGNLFTAATTNRMHLILKERVESHFICAVQAPWALKLHSDCWRYLTWKKAEKYLVAFQNVPAHNFHWFLCQAGYQSTFENPTENILCLSFQVFLKIWLSVCKLLWKISS